LIYPKHFISIGIWLAIKKENYWSNSSPNNRIKLIKEVPVGGTTNEPLVARCYGVLVPLIGSNQYVQRRNI
jgi:hypothetical protein